MSELPEGWASCQLGDLLCHIQAGKSVKCDERPPEGNEPGLVKISAVTWGEFDEIESKTLLTAEGLDERNRIRPGDLLISRANTLELVGAPVIVQKISKHLYLSDKVLRLELPESLREWALICLRSESGRAQIESLATGNQLSMRNISQDALRAIEMPLPPEAEQKRIAQKLDALLTQADSLRERVSTILPLIKRFRHAVLVTAASGRLTQDWRDSNGAQGNESAGEYLRRILESRREEPRARFKPPVMPDTETRNIDVPDSWIVTSVSSVAECLDSMRVPVKKELRMATVGTYPYFGANGEVDRVDEFIFDDDLVLVTEDETFYGRVKPIAYMHSGKCWVNNHVHALRAHDRIGQSYLCYTLMHYDVTPWLTGTTGRAKLTQAALMALPIGMPPPAEQAEIVRRVEQLFAIADQLETKVVTARMRIDTLTQRILAKAFRGELVPQDPNDEPASVLLERIRVQRAAAPKPKRGRKAASN
ncbi:restriction endonuclease subunit S [Stenotrophomonas maltophilia]|uniref:restriction endonuclease subunit S n=1 Tax=uncultured Stenotrophomonas sp. TaxID=165438 RepID=UPI001559B62A|nr:restriction endonuclease subunit S [uncultured Stenotrophomonas sp.]MCI1147283.1 restriction endonuclease subunit S [Stenotrophomonas maltophilia]